MKIFMDAAIEHPNVKIICIGAVGTARELIELDSNLSNRVTETFIPLLKNVELEKIVEQGFSLMNIKCDKTLKEKIIFYSNNLASVCHQISYDICHNRDMKKTNIICKQINENDFKNAVASYVRKNSDTFSKTFDKISFKEERKNILESVINIDKDSVSAEELYEETKKIKKINYDTFTKSLEDLISPEYDEVIRIDRNSKRYYYSNPFFQAFVKMKLALEDLEENRKHKKGICDFPLVDISSIKDFTVRWAIDDKFLEKYYFSLEDVYQKRMISHKTLLEHQKKLLEQRVEEMQEIKKIKNKE
jgi:hypothetical protein